MTRQRVIPALFLLGAAVLLPDQAAAYYGDTHYYMTYYIARRVGYTPEQAYRLAQACVSVDLSFDTEPVQAPEGFLSALDPRPTKNFASLYNQGPRFRFHAFVDQRPGDDFPLYDWERAPITLPVERGDRVPPGLSRASIEQLEEQRRQFLTAKRIQLATQETFLFYDAVQHKNLGILLHFLEDRVPHGGTETRAYGTRCGHWDAFKDSGISLGLPMGGATDWLSFTQTDPRLPLRGPDSNRKLFEETARNLAVYMKVTSGEKQRYLDISADDAFMVSLSQANSPAPMPVPPLTHSTPEDARLVLALKATTPSEAKARDVVNQFIRSAGMTENSVPVGPTETEGVAYNIRADRNWLRDAWSRFQDQESDFYEVAPGMDWEAGVTGRESDQWVIYGSLEVQLTWPTQQGELGSPWKGLQLIVWSTKTQAREEPYRLIDQRVQWGDQPPEFTDLPIGDVAVELLREDGRSIKRTIKLSGKNKVIVLPVDWAKGTGGTSTEQPLTKPVTATLDPRPKPQQWARPALMGPMHDYLAFSPDGKRLVSAGANGMRLWDAVTGQPLGKSPKLWVAASFSPDGRSLVALELEGQGGFVRGPATLVVCDSESFEVNQRHPTSPGGSWQFAASADGRRVATLRGDWARSKQRGVDLWDMSGGQAQVVRRLEIPDTDKGYNLVNLLALSAKGKYCALVRLLGRPSLSGEPSAVVDLWDTGTGSRVWAKVAGHLPAFTPDEQQLAAAVFGSPETSVYLAALPASTPARTIRIPSVALGSMAFSPDGRMLATGGSDGFIRLWDKDDGRLLHTIAPGPPVQEPGPPPDKFHRPDPLPEKIRRQVTSLAFSPDGRALAAGYRDNTLRMWLVPERLRGAGGTQ